MIENSIGLWMLGSVLIFLLIYLRRPKPYRQMLPSLMFLIDDRQKSQKFKFLRNFFSHLLFFLQLLAVLFLSLVASEPTIDRPFQSQGSHTVIVIDTSASMQAAAQGASTRFETAVDEAKNELTRTNTLVTASEPARALLVRKSASDARRELNVLRPTDAPTSLSDAIILAKDQLGSDSGRIIVYSDFALSDPSSLLVAKQAVSDDRTTLTYVQIGKVVPNVGFTDFTPEPGRFSATIRNFNQQPADVTISYKQEHNVIGEQKITLAPLSQEAVTFVPSIGQSQLILESSSDGFTPDNTLYGIVPKQSQLNILVITNAQTTTFLEQALLATGKTTVHRAVPPVVPDFSPYDIIVLHQFNQHVLLPGTFEDLKRFRDNGGGVIVSANEGLEALDSVHLLPVSLTGKKSASSAISAGVSHPLTDDTEFGEVTEYLIGTAKPTSLMLAQTQDKTPVIALENNILYYGLFDDKSSFHSKLSYPIFWLKALDMLHKTADMQTLHVPTGTTITLGAEQAKNPRGETVDGVLTMSYEGYYQKGETTLAANLIDADESAINPQEASLTTLHEEADTSVLTTERTNLEAPLILLGGLLFLSEWFILKRRGSV